jgi:CubicO group peptidase (beta-lactamase class C family)
MGKWFAPIWLILGLTWLAPAAAASDQLQAEFEKRFGQTGVPGAVWTLVTPKAGIVMGAAGQSDATSAKSMTPDTRVHVGSVAKTALAMGVLRLVTRGQLSLDTDVASLLPALRFDNPWQASDPIRIRHLLAHTAGIENFRFRHVFSLRARADLPLAEALGMSELTVRARPGARYVYSSIAYHLLGMVIEAVTRQRYETWLDAELLQPLGMHDSTFAFTSQRGAGADPRLAMGHFENGAAYPAIPVFARPATQFTTTAADMGRLALFLMGDGRLGGKPFIDAVLMTALSGAHDTDAFRAGLSGGHGLALSMRDRHGVVGDCHPGTTIGFQAMLCLYPREGKAFFVAMNADVENADYDQFNKLLIDALRLRVATEPGGAAPPADIAAWEGMYVPTWSAVASLAWIDTVFNVVDLRWDGSRLQLSPFQGKPASLQPAGGMLFRASGRINPSHVLLTSDGERMLSDGLRSYRKIPLAKLLWLWASAASGAVGLFYILIRGGWLLARGRLRSTSTLGLPLAGVLMLVAALPFFAAQSFMQLGDLTVASGLLAFATGALPCAIVYGLLRLPAGRHRIAHPALDCAALLAAAQWLIVLAAWGMLPFLLWR